MASDKSSANASRISREDENLSGSAPLFSENDLVEVGSQPLEVDTSVGEGELNPEGDESMVSQGATDEDVDDASHSEDSHTTPGGGKDVNGKQPETTTGKKSRQSFGSKMQDEATLICDAGERTKIANRRGETLVHSAKILEQRCGAKVYLKAQYVSTRKVINFNWGQDFEMTDDPKAVNVGGTDSLNVSSASLEASVPVDFRQLVSDGIKDAFAHQTEMAASQGVPEEQVSFNSPSGGARRTLISRRKSGTACQVCCQTEEKLVIGGNVIPAQWFFCGSTGCHARIHNDCAGFPATPYEEIIKIAPWYCVVHVGRGRPPITPDAPPNNTEEPPSTRGRRARNSSGDGADETEPSSSGRGSRGKKPTVRGTGTTRGTRGRGGSSRGKSAEK